MQSRFATRCYRFETEPNDRSPPEAKIALFRGRNDVFAWRFESRASGKSG